MELFLLLLLLLLFFVLSAAVSRFQRDIRLILLRSQQFDMVAKARALALICFRFCLNHIEKCR